MKKFLLILILTSLGLTMAGLTLAQSAPNIDPLEALDIITDIIFTILLIIAVIFLIVAGIMFITAAGSEDQIRKARHMVLYAIIGVVVALLARGIVFFLQRYLQPSFFVVI